MKRLPARFTTYVVIGLLVILFAFLTTNRLGAGPVCTSNEAVEAVFVQQMVEHGHYLFPLDNGRGPMYKPPLFHWTGTALDRLSGMRKVTAFNLRLPSALYATAGAALTMVFALSVFGAGPAVLSGLILAAAYEYISQGRLGRVDMTLTFFEALSLFTFMWLLPTLEDERSRRRTALHFLLAASMGLGVLAKGPVGALLPGLAILVFLVLEKRWMALRRLMRPLPLAFGFALASSWYLMCLVGARYGFLNRQIDSENFGRFFGSLGAMPYWYYVQPLLLNAGPITLLIPVAVVMALWMRRAQNLGRLQLDASKSSELECARFFAIFWIVTVVFFELAAYKRKAYLLPLWPPSAVLLAWWTWRVAVPRWGRWVATALEATCVVMLIANFFFISWHEVHECGARLSIAQTLEWPFISPYGEQPSYVTSQNKLGIAAKRVNSIVGTKHPLYVYQLQEPLEPWLFYLNRNLVPVPKPIDKMPSGYVLTRAKVWTRGIAQKSAFKKLLMLPDGRREVVLLYHEAPAKDEVKKNTQSGQIVD